MSRNTTTAYLPDGRSVDVPDDEAEDWRYEVKDGNTTLGLADWYTDQGDDHQDEIRGEADDDTRCDHREMTYRVYSESQIGPNPSQTGRMTRVCHRRACILDAMAWVERGQGGPAAWAGPGDEEFSFELPKSIPLPPVEHDSRTGTTEIRCIGHAFNCDAVLQLESSGPLSEEELATRLREKGWHPAMLCPVHNVARDQTPLFTV